MSRLFFSIEAERRESEKYMLETFPDNNGKELVKLTLNNVAKVEAMIRNDSKYLKASQKDNKKHSPFWILKMREYLLKSIPGDECAFSDVIDNVVKYIDQENTTHLNTDGGRFYMALRIKRYRNKLIPFLQNPTASNYEIIDYLIGNTGINEGRNDGKQCHLSFASKFCHYSCFYMFEGTHDQDNFPIYDSVVKKALPDYCVYFGLERKSQKKLSNYNEYRKTIDQIIEKNREKTKERISRNGFDHLIWYYFKGRQ